LPSTILLLKTTNKLIRFLFLNYNKIKNKKQINQKIRNYKNLEKFKKRKQKNEKHVYSTVIFNFWFR